MAMDGPSAVSASAQEAKNRHRLERSCRLGSAAFRKVFDGGISFVSRYFALWLLAGADIGGIGVVASKRTFHDAHERNRAKRLLREAYRTRREHVPPGAMIVMIGRRRILEATSRDVGAEFEKTCRKAGVWSD